MRIVREGQLRDLAIGAAILGTGGGGNPYIGSLLAAEAIRAHGPVTVVDVGEVPDEAVVIPAARMGAPTVGVEKLPSGDEAPRAVEALQEALGARATHIVCIEVGGGNSMTPFVVAATLGLPLVDADGMGRAFPELQMVTPSITGVAATPMAMADEKGNRAVLTTIDNLWAERIARAVTIEMGCTAAIAFYPMSGRQVRETMVPGTLKLAEDLGRLVRETRAAHGDPVAAVMRRLGGRQLFSGNVADVDRRTEGGFARGTATLAGTGPDQGGRLEIRFQNEFLLGSRDGLIVASVPDLVILLERETGEPITTEELRYGLRVRVLGAPCHPAWRSGAGLKLVGPRSFGYDIEYVPLL